MLDMMGLHVQLLEVFPKAIKGMLAVYFIFKVLDFGSGLLKTWKGVVDYSSRVMRDGIIRWIGELVGIVFVLTIDMVLGLNFFLTGFALSLFIYKEGGSIDENLKAIDVNLPEAVSEKLKVFNKGK
ncbi:phage holin family protein [Niallia nealsonii]|uniref:Holin n=1 Tax=Niallia nealsonii TaxID=115979 RepID=A0A2N0Z368_9BACI|nr:phage holin family protein [Niallia nealsonii]PKG23953.1 holin [Niallia nealsonii]